MGMPASSASVLPGFHPGRYRPPIGERDPLSAALWSLIDDRRILLAFASRDLTLQGSCATP